MVGGDSSFVIGDFANQVYNTCIRNKQSNSPNKIPNNESKNQS